MNHTSETITEMQARTARIQERFKMLNRMTLDDLEEFGMALADQLYARVLEENADDARDFVDGMKDDVIALVRRSGRG